MSTMTRSTLSNAGSNILANNPAEERGKTPSKSSLRRSGTAGSGFRVGVVDSATVSTPRTAWRNQYWNKTTPWATDRVAYAGAPIYETTIKPTSSQFNNELQWHVEGYNKPPEVDPSDIVRAMVHKLEQHCRSTQMLTRMFKMFDRDSSSTIDRHEMAEVLMMFSIELNDEQMNAVMNHFGAVQSKGEALISYSKFVEAIEKTASLHPLDMQQKNMTGRERRSMGQNLPKNATRLCTPGFKAPVGCPLSGSFYPEDSLMLKIHTTPQTQRDIIFKKTGSATNVLALKRSGSSRFVVPAEDSSQGAYTGEGSFAYT